ncbi:PspA/IM30 family protein [Clostridium sp.]|uniref:PspA/IM30 family protein n=1 Tax=Clostridium sp. TaxID=1506 RepID=UPI0026DC32C0|nr:PspA/IM30 family protein [Clostridium sp.]MDO5039841.1 PspA/IM30 family protein [Clostridium sp.]
MGIFNRISNMLKAKTNSALDNMENPIELLDQKIRDMEESLNKAKLSSAQIFGNLKEIEKEMDKTKAIAVEYDEKVKLAMSKNNEELAKKALKLKLDADKKLQTLTTSHTELEAKAKSLKENLVKLQEEIEKTRSYRDEASARLNTANATKQVNEIMANVQTKKNSINLDDIERKIAKEESYAEGLKDLRTPSLDDEFAALENDNLDAELEKYRNK